MTAAAGGSPTLWLVILAVAVGSLAWRLSFILLFGRLNEVPPRVERALRFVPPAVFAAIALPGIVLVDGSLALSPANERLVAGGLAAIVAWHTESLVATIAVGMGALLALGTVV